ncbi:MAG: carboxypeptidase-like regulatory domain-containing protein [Planctomycetota bacterium]
MRLQTTLLSALAAVCALGVGWLALSVGGSSRPLGKGESLTVETADPGASDGGLLAEEVAALSDFEVEGSGVSATGDLPVGEVRATARREAALASSLQEWSVRLFVEDQKSGEPVVDARVLEVFLGGEPLAEERDWRAMTSDKEGRLDLIVRLDASDPGPGESASPRLDLRLGAEGYSVAVVASLAVALSGGVDAADIARADADLDGAPSRVVQLQPAASLVLDVLGAPQSGSGELALWYASKARREEPDLSLAWPLAPAESDSSAEAADRSDSGVSVQVSAASGGARRVRFGGLPSGALSIALAVEGYPLALQQALTLLPGEELHESIELTQGENAAGVVVDLETRQPVGEVQVHAIPEIPWISERINRRPYPAVTTDSSGRFILVGVPEGKLGVELITPDGASHARHLTVVKGNHARKHELRVRGTAALAGTLVLPSEAALVDPQVLVTTAEAASSVRFVDGRLQVLGNGGPGVLAEVNVRDRSFVATRVPSGRKLIVHAIADGMTHGTASVPPLKLDDTREGVRLYLAERQAIEFRVTASTGEVVTAIRASFFGPRHVGALDGDAANSANARKGRASRWLPWVELDVDPSGVFRADPALARIEQVRIAWEDRAKARFDWTGAALDDVPTFELIPDPIVLVEVAGENGAAVAGARVVAQPVDLSAVTAVGDASKGRESRGGPRAFTDAFGRARLKLTADKDGRTSERYELRVSATGYQAAAGIELGASDALPSPPIEVILAPAEVVVPGTITGRIVRRNGEPVVSPRFDGMRGGSAHVSQHSFVIRGVRPGRAKIVVHAEGFEAQKLAPIRVQPGERVDVGEVVMNWASRVDVKVLNAKGKPVPSASVQLVRMSKKVTRRTDLPRAIQFPSRGRPAGVYRRTGVARVPWRLVVKHRGHKPFTKVIRVKKALESIDVALEAIP